MFIINGQLIGFNNHVNYINIFYDKELLVLYHSKMFYTIILWLVPYLYYNKFEAKISYIPTFLFIYFYPIKW